MSTPKITVAIATWNTAEMTKRCVERIIECSDMETIEIIVVDDGSTDNTADLLAPWFFDLGGSGKANCRLISLKKNLGYPTAMNSIMGDVDALHYFVTVNSDLLVCPGWLEKFDGEFQKNPKLGVCGVKGTSCQLDQNFMGHRGNRVDYVEGSCAMYSMRALNFTGLYDPAFRRAYCEDTDLSLRIRKAGYDLALIDLPIKHLGQQSTKVAIREGQDIAGFEHYNRLLLKKKWAGFLSGNTNPRKILVVRHMALGDVVMTTPIIAALKKKHPHSDIDVETRYTDVFSGNPNVRATFQPREASRQNYQLVIDLNGCYEENLDQHYVKSYADKAGVELTDWQPKIYPSAADRELAKDQVNGGFCVAFHALEEQIPGKSLDKDVIDRLISGFLFRGWRVIHLNPRTTPTIGELAAVIERCQAFIGSDSGPAHVAQALNIPSVVIFGNCDPSKVMVQNVPYFEAVTARPLEVGCLGCHHVDSKGANTSRCLREGNDRNRCMKMIHPEDVFEALDRVLKAAPVLEVSR